jgi:hypothetical protein
MTSRARELPYTDNDQVELVRRCGAVKQLVRQWPKRRLNAGSFHQYLGEIAAATERLFAWVDELWLYGTGGRVAFDAEIAEENAADPSTLSVTQLQRRCSRERWWAAVALAGRLAEEARATGDLDEAQRLERAFVRTVLSLAACRAERQGRRLRPVGTRHHVEGRSTERFRRRVPRRAPRDRRLRLNSQCRTERRSVGVFAGHAGVP